MATTTRPTTRPTTQFEPRRSGAIGAPIRPGSLLWRTAGDARSLLPGTAAGIMQLMYPSLGAGVTEHSNFFDDPFDRIFRSVPYIWRSILAANDEEGDAAGRLIRGFHDRIKGVDDDGRRYHALDPETFWWAHATFTWEFFRAHELFFPVPLSRSAKSRLYAESVTWYRRYGVSDRVVPPTYRDFVRRFDEICRFELDLTPAVRWVMNPEDNPAARPERLELSGPMRPLSGVVSDFGAEFLRLMVYGCLPDSIRRRFDLPWTNRDRASFVSLCATIRSLDLPIRFGLLDGLFPEGTPHLAPGRIDALVVAGPSWRQRQEASAQT